MRLAADHGEHCQAAGASATAGVCGIVRLAVNLSVTESLHWKLDMKLSVIQPCTGMGYRINLSDQRRRIGGSDAHKGRLPRQGWHN